MCKVKDLRWAMLPHAGWCIGTPLGPGAVFHIHKQHYRRNPDTEPNRRGDETLD
jgi:hypothetical protein